jgi:hypothetical protein
MAHGRFGTAVNCMDGRVQLPVINWMKENFQLDYVDMITEPGADKILGAGPPVQIEAIKTKVLISVVAHGSRIVAVAGHDDRAGNPVEPDQHKLHLREALKTVLSWNLPLDEVFAVWINRDWQVEIVASE